MTNERMNLAFDLVVTLPCLWFFFKETKGLTLEEIDVMFGGRALGMLRDDLEKSVEGEGGMVEETYRSKD